MRAPEPGSLRLRLALSACTAAAVCAVLFALVVLGVTVADHLGAEGRDPVDHPALEELRVQVRAEPQRDDLRAELRDLDQRVRAEHRASLALRGRAGGLLLGAVALLLLALRLRAALLPAPPPVARPLGRPRCWFSLASSRGSVTGLGAAVVVAGLLLWASFPPPEPGSGELPVPLPPTPAWEERLAFWPSFRGPDGLGLARGGSAPLDWDGQEGRNLRWKAPVPRPGTSSPIAWGDRVFLTGGDDRARELYCFHADTGDLLWRHDAAISGAKPAPLPAVRGDTGHAAASPATDGVRVFAIFSNGDLVAVDFTGRRVWSRQLGVPQNPYGHASSLLVWRDRLIVQYDQRDRTRVLALDTATGATAWERDRDQQMSWASPVLIPGALGEELVLSGNPWVVAYDPATGSELWRIKLMRGELAASPAWGGGMVIAGGRFAKLAAFLPGEHATVLWEHKDDLPQVPSPVATDDFVFVASDGGAVSCLDVYSGELLWREEFDDGFYASPVVSGDRVYALDRQGVMRVFAAAAEPRLLASPALGEPASSTGAFVGDRIYLRGSEHLFCIEEGP